MRNRIQLIALLLVLPLAFFACEDDDDNPSGPPGPDTTAPATPGVVLDPFGGTGTTALVAHALGRHGISVDMSSDYCRLAQWRTSDPNQLANARQVDKPAKQIPGQEDLFTILDGEIA